MARTRKTNPYGDPHPQKRIPLYHNKNDSNIATTPWPNLPQRLTKHMATHPNTLLNINFGLATKSWRSEPKTRHRVNIPGQNQPCLLVHDDVVSTPRPIQFCSLEFRREYWWYRYERNRPWPISTRYPWNHFEGCSQGILLARPDSPENSSELFLYQPWHRWHMHVPTWDASIPFKCAALSSKYAYPTTGVLMIATGVSSPAFLFCKLGQRMPEWTKLDCKRNGRDLMSFTNAIGFEGKFYALSSQGTLAVIREVTPSNGSSGDSRFEIEALGKTRAVPSVPFRGFKECLIESNGDVLLVLLASIATVKAFDSVEVYRLCFDDFSWKKMESLGDRRTLFVGNDCCVSVRADEVGCRGDCVYFTQRSSDVWFEFDMRNGSVSRPWTDRDTASTGNPLEWDRPVVSRNDDKVKAYLCDYV